MEVKDVSSLYLVLVGQPGSITKAVITDLALACSGPVWLAQETACITEVPASAAQGLKDLLPEHALDWLLTPRAPKPAKLFLADMDSTMITAECIDELAGFAGIKAEVSAVTEAAMRGELDFEAALKSRVALLKGLKTSVLEECYRDKVHFSDGARIAVQTMRAHGTYCALVSGGFTFFTERVAVGLGFHEQRANRLEEKDGHLTGKVITPISNANTKLSALETHSARLEISPDQSLAVGDGANDIPMLEAAGLGVAYRAKPNTKAAADCAIDKTDLTSLLYFQGITQAGHASL
ncbi:MAG: phosphoserine phosphatase SerB [Pseudomonadota bacterium]